ncbi:hypothetical protein V8E55_005018, partial [Tylopilus felleus]
KGTHTAAKLPANAEEKCEESFFRLVYIMKWYDVPPKLLIGFDQIGNYVLPSSGTTFAERGSRQVDIIAKDEKRAYMLLVASTPEGTFLPFQQWVEHIVEPYHRQVIEADPDLNENQVSIIYLDCYPVHTSEDFRSYIFEEFPCVILCFVPAGCTGIFQPADQHQTEYLVETHQQQINSGLTTEQVKFSTLLPVLRDASVTGIVSIFNFMTGPFGRELVKKSWERCRVKDWNLSAKCLTSRAAQIALDEYLRTHPSLHDEIKNRTGVVYGIASVASEEVPPDELEDQVAAEVDDDADVPSSAVIRDETTKLTQELAVKLEQGRDLRQWHSMAN